MILSQVSQKRLFGSVAKMEGVLSLAAETPLAENSPLGSGRNNRTLTLGFAALKSQKTQQCSWQASGETASGPTVYLYDGVNIVEEVDGSGSLLARYTQGIGIDDPMTTLRSGTASYYQADALGTVTSLSSASGALANTYTYDSYGKPTASTGTITNRYGFTGRELDSETGIYYYRFRYYDQKVGRFITEDPIAWRGGIDFYRYADGNPVSKTDPLGLDEKVCFYADAAGGFGHVGYGVPGEQSTQGFSPVNTWEGLDGPGQVGIDKEKKSQCKIIPASQDQCMLRCRIRRQSNPGNYKLFSRQCTSFVRDCLKECGLPAGGYTGPRPKPFFDGLPK